MAKSKQLSGREAPLSSQTFQGGNSLKNQTFKYSEKISEVIDSNKSQKSFRNTSKRTLEESIWSIPNKFDSFLVISPINKEESLSDITYFKRRRALYSLKVNYATNITNLKSGEILIQVSDAIDSDRIKRCTSFANIPVTVTPHKTLNTSKGVIKTREFNGCAKEELIEGIDEIIDAYQVKINRSGQSILTSTWILTFNTPKPPTVLYVDHLKLPVRPYTPNPMRCYNCQKYGHTSKRCTGKPICSKCGQLCKNDEETHNHFRNCTSSMWCPNCKQSGHVASSKECTKWKHEKAILDYKAQHGGTFAQARTALSFHQTITKERSYANAVRSTEVPSAQKPNSSQENKYTTKIQNSEKPNTHKNETSDDFTYQTKQKKKKNDLKTLNQKKNDSQSFSGIETPNPFAYLSQPEISMSTRMVNTDNDYLSSSAPPVPMETSDPSQLPPSQSGGTDIYISNTPGLNVNLEGGPYISPPSEEAEVDHFATPPTSEDGHTKLSAASSPSFPSSPLSSPPPPPPPPPPPSKGRPKHDGGPPIKTLTSDFSPGSSKKPENTSTLKDRGRKLSFGSIGAIKPYSQNKPPT